MYRSELLYQSIESHYFYCTKEHLSVSVFIILLSLTISRLYGGMNYRRLGGGVGVIKMTHCESHIW